MDIELAARERLLRAAVDSFAAHGFEGSSLRAIADSADVAFQLITYYFGTKDELWTAAVGSLFESQARSWPVAIDSDKDFPAQLRAWMRNALAANIQRPQLRQIMCQEFLAGSKRYERHVRPQMKKSIAQFSLLFDDARRRGFLFRFSTKEMILLCRGLLTMAAVAPDEITSLIGAPLEDERSIDLLADLIVSILLHGKGTAALNQLGLVRTV